MTDKKIESLTPEQEALLPIYRDKWLAIGLSCEPADREAIPGIIARVYQAAGLAPPEKIEFARSPLEAARRAAELSGRDVASCFHDQVFGSHDAAWLAFYDFMDRELAIEAASRLRPLMELAQVCGWWAPYEHLCICQDRHSVLKRDPQNRLHCEDGPAVAYPDGSSYFFWRGTAVPDAWILGRATLTAQAVLAAENTETRRAGCEIIGWAKILDDLDALVLDEDPDPQIGTLYEVNLPDAPGSRFLRYTCGTGRIFAKSVPAEAQSARQAQQMIWGDDDYDPEIRT